ncbi:MAG: anti-sigma factor antagonist [Clostridia bacterium]|nr:anti-sigma factor antagonist [Clostridia bacterium]
MIKFKRAAGAVVVKIDGEIDAESAKALRRRIDMEYDALGVKDMIFDLSNVSFMDSPGIGMMIGRYKRVRAIGGRVKIFGADKNVGRIIELSGLGGIMRVYKSEKAAMEG